MDQLGGVRGDPQAANAVGPGAGIPTIDRRRITATAAVGSELLVVDSGIGEAQMLVGGRRSGIDVVHLAGGGRGLEQIIGHLADHRGVTALHLLSHGEPGVLVLAGERVDLPAVAMRRAVLSAAAEAFAPGAIVAIYGCSVAAGAAGLQFLDYLETVLGVGVAASAGPVGAAALGGRWTLRDRNGATVETAFTRVCRASYPALFAVGRPDLAPARPAAGFPCLQPAALRPSAR